MSVNCQGRWRQRYSKSEPTPGDHGEFAISTNSSVGLRTGVESDVGVGLRV
jgi:hypothetical protein